MFIPFQDDNRIRRSAVVTYAIIAVNAIVFLWSTGLAEKQRILLTYRFGFVPARIGQLVDPKPIEVGIAQIVPQVFGMDVVRKERFELSPSPGAILLTLVTSTFLHGGWMHLLGNMWFLWIFGDNVEDRLGRVLFPVFYFTGGLLASACQWAIDPRSTVPIIGASGAIACVLGAYAVTWPWSRVRTLVFLVVFFTVVELPALLVLGGWFVSQLLEATQQTHLGLSGGVAWWVHVGGFVAGAGLMPLFSSLSPLRPVEAERIDDGDEDRRFPHYRSGDEVAGPF